MPPELADLVAPSHTALVTQECQNGVLGDAAIFPQLADIAREEMIPNAARLVKGARAAGVTVAHCLALRRPDGRGSNTNARLFAAAARSSVALTPGSPAAEVIPEIGMEEDDLVSARFHGLGPMAGTDLDPQLRNLGVSTIVGIGVSINVGMTNFVMDAVNLGYQFVLPRDAVAGVPRSYAAAVIENTISLLATVVTTDELLETWQG
ncbi:MAG TPA: cysteine hydrolase [Actinomycetota bacterium]|nr:cysteine hydrolase [Actinomycetota bacterium]